MHFTKKVLSIVAGLLCLTVVVACGSSSKSSAPTTTALSSSATTASGTSGTSATPAASGAPIKVGFLCACSGDFGYIGIGAHDVYQAWVESVNASGGINGHPIQLIYEDDQYNPGNAAIDAQTVLKDGVVAVVDASALDSVWEKTVAAAKIPVIGTIITSIPFYTDPDFFAQGETNDSLVAALANTIKESGATTFGQIYCAEAPQCQQAVPLIKAAATKIGLNDAYNTEIAATAPNYTAQCLAAKQAGVQAAFIGDGAPIIAKVGANCSQQGYNPTFVIEGNSVGSITTSGAGLRNSLWAQFNYQPYFSKAPEVEAMNAAVNKYFPGLRNNATDWTQQGAGSWPAGLLLEDAIKAGGLAQGDTPTSAEILKGLYSLKADTLQGWSPPLTFTPGKPTSVDCWFTGRVQDGVPALVNGGKLTCSNGSSS